ncbi:Alpha-tubulin n-acetyltransferase, partial [Globisporangium splendens]
MQVEVVENVAQLAADAALAAAIDELGERSAVAQQLNRAITSAALFTLNVIPQQQKLYVAVDASDRSIVGFLKTGVKHLFYVSKMTLHGGEQDRKGVYTEIDPLCVLDFFVDERYRRQGVGLRLFQRLLEVEHVEPRQLAYDRPSPKLFAFLKKHAGLEHFAQQSNNFVIFDDYFQ